MEKQKQKSHVKNAKMFSQNFRINNPHLPRKASQQRVPQNQWQHTFTITTSFLMLCAMTMEKSNAAIAIVSLLLATTCIKGILGISIGVNYGTIANNLPPPAQVAKFLQQSTVIDRVKLYDMNPAILKAFANTGIPITVAVSNDQIPSLADLTTAQQWVGQNILPYTTNTNIIRILVGNEVISTAAKELIANLMPAMQNLHTALTGALLSHHIKVSTPHSLGILSTSFPPSAGKFRKGYDTIVLKPLLNFLRATNAPFMINPYPYFGFTPDTINYALFQPNSGVYDSTTQVTYTNMLDGQLDATYSAMKLLGFTDVDIVIAETGWPSLGDPWQIGADMASAVAYNGNLIRHVTSGVGTPLMPNRTFETYIFALFNENLKPGPTTERNFGLFRPDMTPVYNIGIVLPTVKRPTHTSPTPILPPYPGPNRTPILPPYPGPTRTPILPPYPGPTTGKRWCLPKSNAEPVALQVNIDYVCGQGIDCRQIQVGGTCYLPNTIRAHAAYAMNLYYQQSGRNSYDCDFGQTGAITTIDPSYGECIYNS